ncbi:MAG TPA: tetratricopeptide repeat protein, partial [Caulobacteraceae bacterium]|nr:tetratricopeptide repeat protein [Caulobacteraceae bacterium]
MSERPGPPPASPPIASGRALEQAAAALRAGRPDEAERLARSVLATDPGHALGAQALGHAALSQGRAAGAIEPMSRAARLSGEPAVEALLARVLAVAGRTDEAFAQLRRTVQHRPAFPLAFLELAEQLGRANRADEAQAVLEQGVALAPQALVLQVALANLWLARGERAPARRLFVRLHAAAPDRQDVVAGLARLEALEGRLAAAADLYRQALALRPGDAVT